MDSVMNGCRAFGSDSEGSLKTPLVVFLAI